MGCGDAGARIGERGVGGEARRGEWRAKAQSRREVWGVAEARRDAELGVPGRLSPTIALEVSALRLCGSARPVRVWRRSALRAGGGRGGVVFLAPSRKAAKRSGGLPTIAVMQRWGGRPGPVPTVWMSPTMAPSVSAWRLGGLARPVRVPRDGDRLFERGGGRRGVVFLAPSRQAAKRSGVSLASAATRSWAGCPSPMPTVWRSPTTALEMSSWRLGGLARPSWGSRRTAEGGRGASTGRASKK